MTYPEFITKINLQPKKNRLIWLDILAHFFQNDDSIKISDLAKKYYVSKRTVYTYLEIFANLELIYDEKNLFFYYKNGCVLCRKIVRKSQPKNEQKNNQKIVQKNEQIIKQKSPAFLDNSLYEKKHKKPAIFIMQKLNEYCGKNFIIDAYYNIEPIEEKLRQGFTVSQLEYVIKVKSKQWLGNGKMEKYLRPSTLFGDKFESYLQEKISEKKSKIDKLSETLKKAQKKTQNN